MDSIALSTIFLAILEIPIFAVPSQQMNKERIFSNQEDWIIQDDQINDIRRLLLKEQFGIGRELRNRMANANIPRDADIKGSMLVHTGLVDESRKDFSLNCEVVYFPWPNQHIFCCEKRQDCRCPRPMGICAKQEEEESKYEADESECPCMNGGTCETFDTEGTVEILCVCPMYFEGALCEHTVIPPEELTEE